MILIQSDASETTTDDVLHWLYHLGARDIVRWNDDTPVGELTFHIGQQQPGSVTANGERIPFADLDAYWYRRGSFTFRKPDIFRHSGPMHNTLGHRMEAYYRHESGFAQRAFYRMLRSRNGINSFSDNDLCKLRAQQIAVECGLRTPDTILTNSFDQLLSFARQYPSVITKAINYPYIKVRIDETHDLALSVGTVLLDYRQLEAMQIEGEIEMSLAQEYVDKRFEIRSFYLNGAFYSMAIFSQENERTKIDFRNYDYDRPNRCAPYRLPADIEDKLTRLMARLELNSGSFDLIYTPEGEHYFLEVNPIGQMQWVDRNCNYFIDREIARTLYAS